MSRESSTFLYAAESVSSELVDWFATNTDVRMAEWGSQTEANGNTDSAIVHGKT
jgi:hypothetical protein